MVHVMQPSPAVYEIGYTVLPKKWDDILRFSIRCYDPTPRELMHQKPDFPHEFCHFLVELLRNTPKKWFEPIGPRIFSQQISARTTQISAVCHLPPCNVTPWRGCSMWCFGAARATPWQPTWWGSHAVEATTISWRWWMTRRNMLEHIT